MYWLAACLFGLLVGVADFWVAMTASVAEASTTYCLQSHLAALHPCSAVLYPCRRLLLHMTGTLCSVAHSMLFHACRYGYSWKVAEAEKNLLRTHTTAVSSRMLYKLAQEGFKPAKYFSIDRVFRNEAVDRTHLAEFHQIEGKLLLVLPCLVTLLPGGRDFGDQAFPDYFTTSC